MSQEIKNLVESVNRLAATDPNSDHVQSRVDEIMKTASAVKTAATATKETAVIGQIDKMRSAAVVPASNYGRVVRILDGLRHAAVLAQEPQNEPVREQIASIVNKVAGVFAEIDTVQDLDKPLAEVESAVHALYGKQFGEQGQSSNKMSYFERRGKGFHK